MSHCQRAKSGTSRGPGPGTWAQCLGQSQVITHPEDAVWTTRNLPPRLAHLDPAVQGEVGRVGIGAEKANAPQTASALLRVLLPAGATERPTRGLSGRPTPTSRSVPQPPPPPRSPGTQGPSLTPAELGADAQKGRQSDTEADDKEKLCVGAVQGMATGPADRLGWGLSSGSETLPEGTM